MFSTGRAKWNCDLTKEDQIHNLLTIPGYLAKDGVEQSFDFQRATSWRYR
jgi:hypothetical protein